MTPNGWLIYSKADAIENKSYIDWFIKEASLQDLSLKLILREDVTTGILNNKQIILLQHQQVDLPHFSIVRTVDPLLSFYLEACGIKVFNSAAISKLCNHKSHTHYEMAKLGIPMIDTIFMRKENITQSLPMPFPFVVKNPTGRSGKQVYFIQSNKEWNQCLSILSTEDLIVQSANALHGKDVRVFVVGKEIIGAVLRENTTDFRANFKLGGSARWYPLNNIEIKWIKKIINHIDFDVVGIDFLIDLDGNLLFNEIEDVVGSRTLSIVSDQNLLEKYVTHIKKKLIKKSGIS